MTKRHSDLDLDNTSKIINSPDPVSGKDAANKDYVDTVDAADKSWLKLDDGKPTDINDDIYTNGKVGVGTNSPTEELDVEGDVRFGNVGKWISSANVLKAEDLGTRGAFIRSSISAVTNPTYSNVDDENTGIYFPSDDTLALTTGGTERLRVTNTGNIGIGTSSPTELLDVAGKGLIDGLEIWKGNNTLSSNLGVGANILGNITSGVSNTAIGTNSLSLVSSGSVNTAISTGALQFNSSGSNNTAIGVNALRFNNSGAGNLAIGLSASRDGTTKANTIAIGNNALRGGNGSNNIGIGVNAGITATGSNNTFIGNFITSNDSNSVFIANGNGSLRLQVDTNGNHIYPDYGDSKTETEVIRHQSGMNASGQKVQQLMNEGQIKINGSGANVKPSILGVVADVAQFFQYDQGALNLSTSPTTQFPLNQAAVDASIIDPVTFQFLENPELGSVNVWRINYTYSGKAGGNNLGLSIGFINPLSTFIEAAPNTLPSSSQASNNVDFGGGDIRLVQETAILVTIADAASIGTGYKLFAVSTLTDGNFSVTIDSVVRYNATKYKR